MSPFSSTLPTVLLLLLLGGAALARPRHVINISKPDLHPSTLAWDPSGQHFLVGSRGGPSIYSVSDAGVIETLISDEPTLPSSSSVSAITVDDSRRRLIVAFSVPALIAAYDLRSPRPHRRIFASALPDPSAVIGGVAVDPATGTAFITGSDLIWTADLEGRISEFSRSPIFSSAHVSEGLGGVAHVSRGFLLVVQRGKGRVFKVDAEDGTAREVLVKAEAAEAVMVRSDGAAVVAGGMAARWLKSEDGWGEAGVYDEIKVEKGERVKGVAVREGRRAYILVTAEEEEEEEGERGGLGIEEGYNGKEGEGRRSRIEEIEWGKDGEGEMVWGMVLVGLALAYFLYWRFQMGQLVTNINKKRE